VAQPQPIGVAQMTNRWLLLPPWVIEDLETLQSRAAMAHPLVELSAVGMAAVQQKLSGPRIALEQPQRFLRLQPRQLLAAQRKRDGHQRQQGAKNGRAARRGSQPGMTAPPLPGALAGRR